VRGHFEVGKERGKGKRREKERKERGRRRKTGNKFLVTDLHKTMTNSCFILTALLFSKL